MFWNIYMINRVTIYMCTQPGVITKSAIVLFTTREVSTRQLICLFVNSQLSPPVFSQKTLLWVYTIASTIVNLHLQSPHHYGHFVQCTITYHPNYKYAKSNYYSFTKVDWYSIQCRLIFISQFHKLNLFPIILVTH